MLPGAEVAGRDTWDQLPALRRWVTWAGVLLIALIIVADAYEGWQDYRTAIGDNDRGQLELGRALAEQTSRMLQEVDLVLTDHAAWELSAEGQTATPLQLSAHLAEEVRRLPFIYSATVADANGDVVASTRADIPGLRSLRTRDAFLTAQRGTGNTLHIGRPFISSRDGSVTFTLSRRMADAHGNFRGVVVARVAFEYLASFYAGVVITPDAQIRLAREDGIVLAQFPSSSNFIAENNFVKRSYAALMQGREQLHRERQADGSSRVVALHAVEGYPAVVEVSRSLASVRQPWLQRELASAVRTLVLAVLAGLLLMALRAALSRRDRLEAERQRLAAELEQAQRAEALGFLAAAMAHDFNNVLTAIVGYAELAKNTIPPGSAALANIERLFAAGERARLLVRKVLTFDPRRSIGYQALPLRPIIEEVVQQLKATLPPAVSLQLGGLETDAQIYGDATEVHQVLMNLCSNAIQAMPQGGTLSISVAIRDLQAVPAVRVGRLVPGRWVCLQVSDAGIGLTEDRLRWIFEPFYTTRQPGKGNGIGLTVVRNIVTRMSGAIEVSSEAGNGTCMTVYWPLQSEVPRLEQPDSPSARSAGRGETVMIVDDEPELVRLTEELVASLGYEPVGFVDARAALAAFEQQPDRYDLVLTDERMPALRGAELGRLIHEIRATVPVMLMTGHRDGDLEQQARVAGITTVLDKPLRTQMLSEAIERHLAGRADRATSPAQLP
jgi:signal transduction histidine kinase/ActR/RegA family two-component response regulator